ncbi:hypothetical protein NQ176_g172 [Zarea fungicola]|uniref:Uncharacterized protein n=1 Tax=Zarea fungicola TaxID=93591 RepID=A0ACC1NZG8_9HYPO|nr:hypothetical protein NQ176_g172 [Lecanicillium fungicola]
MTRPHLIFGSCSLQEHAIPTLRVAAAMAERGYDITILINDGYKALVDKLGGKFVSIPSVDDLLTEPERLNLPEGPVRASWDLLNIFIGSMPARYAILKETLVQVNKRAPSTPIVIIVEPGFLGANPLWFNANILNNLLTVTPKVLGLGISCYPGYSADLAPYMLVLPPDGTESGRLRNDALHQLVSHGPMAPALARYKKGLNELGVLNLAPFRTMGDAILACQQRVLMLHPASIDYPMSDLPARVKFVGALPPQPLPSDFRYPSWWSKVMASGKKIIMVTQGTVDLDYENLIIPTFKALATRTDVIVVAILGKYGAQLPPGVSSQVPVNTYVVDYLLYSALLPHAALCIMNASWGGMMQVMSFGVPMILAGRTEDKPEALARANWLGFGIGLNAVQPVIQQIATAVDLVFSDGKFKSKIRDIQLENEALRPFDRIENEILDLANSD